MKRYLYSFILYGISFLNGFAQIEPCISCDDCYNKGIEELSKKNMNYELAIHCLLKASACSDYRDKIPSLIAVLNRPFKDLQQRLELIETIEKQLKQEKEQNTRILRALGFENGRGWAYDNRTDKFALIDERGRKLTQAIYEEVEPFQGDLAKVKQSGKEVFINRFGKEVTDKFIFSIRSNNGLYLVKSADTRKYALADSNFKAVSKWYDHIGHFSENKAWVMDNTRIGFINEEGKEVIACKYLPHSQIDDENRYNFSEGIAWVRKEDVWGAIDPTGKEIIDFVYDDVRNFSNGVAWVKLGTQWELIESNGNLLKNNRLYFEDVQMFSEGYAGFKKNGKWGVINSKGDIIVKEQYYDIGLFQEGLAMIVISPSPEDLKNLTYGFIDTKGSIIIPPKYHYQGQKYSFQKGYVTVKTQDFGILKKDGNLALGMIYDTVYNFGNGTLAALRGHEWFVWNERENSYGSKARKLEGCETLFYADDSFLLIKNLNSSLIQIIDNEIVKALDDYENIMPISRSRAITKVENGEYILLDLESNTKILQNINKYISKCEGQKIKISYKGEIIYTDFDGNFFIKAANTMKP